MTNEFRDSFTVRRPVTRHEERFMPGDVLIRSNGCDHMPLSDGEEAYIRKGTNGPAIGFSLSAIKHATMSS